MRIVSIKRIREFTKKHPQAGEPLQYWAAIVKAATWKTTSELKASFVSASFVSRSDVFNIGGNNYRLVAFVHYKRQIVYIKQILTHKAYDKGV